jgi:hypothetical protein
LSIYSGRLGSNCSHLERIRIYLGTKWNRNGAGRDDSSVITAAIHVSSLGKRNAKEIRTDSVDISRPERTSDEESDWRPYERTAMDCDT